ncbi:uncharacterized protein LOC133154192 isoform X1 [Syngnathus typhle]|uniref:uncharacterized protein LOC133154192 isoform X1 n=1 Tax=Syngnathus typhle TaxID=161592 RepID=UPI002A69CD29|nr:uncharacterized protein LOC133154192 isoform X1 [Syngnathus typhle]
MCANATNGASCSSRDVACQCQLYMKYSDTGGFQGGLGGLSVGRTLVIKGQSIPQATKLGINMEVRDSNGKETGNNALHLNIDIGAKSFTVNAKVSEKLTGSLPQQNPFGPGLPFEVTSVAKSAFNHHPNSKPVESNLHSAFRRLDCHQVWQWRFPADFQRRAPAGLCLSSSGSASHQLAVGVASGADPRPAEVTTRPSERLFLSGCRQPTAISVFFPYCFFSSRHLLLFTLD